jgi:hypothetical protein
MRMLPVRFSREAGRSQDLIEIRGRERTVPNSRTDIPCDPVSRILVVVISVGFVKDG